MGGSAGLPCSNARRDPYNGEMTFRSTLFALSLVSGACVPLHSHRSFSATSAQRYEPRPDDCALDAFVTVPNRPFQEIGVFDVGNDGHDRATTLDLLRAMVGPDACRAGADGLIASANGYGLYIKAVAFRWIPAPAPGTAPAPGAAPSPYPSPAPAEAVAAPQ